MQDAHDPYGALKLRDYRRLLAGSILYTLGTEMQAVAVGMELWRRTGSKAALGWTGFVQFMPVLCLALTAGHAADRVNRQKLLMTAQTLGALTSLGLAILSFWQGPIYLIYLCLFLVGVARAFNVPARWALLPQVVPTELLPNAVNWNSSGFQIANVAGPALGGLVLATATPALAYALACVCGLGCVALVGTLRPRTVERARESRTLQSLLAGIRFVWRTKPILATISLDLFAVLFGGATALLPVFADDILEVGDVGYGIMRAAPAFGAFIMAFVLAHHPPLHNAGRLLLAVVAGFGVAWIVFGLSRSYPLSLAMLVVTGALDNISVVIRGTLVQTLTPEAMRGRVGAVNIVFVSSSNELGGFESGITAHYFGTVPSVVMGGVGTLLVVGTVLALWPPILRLGIARSALPVEGETVQETVP
jgi:MFS family permease